MIKVNKGAASSVADSNLNLRSNHDVLHQTRERDFVFWLLIIFALLAFTEAVLLLGFSLMGRSAVASLGIDIGPLPSAIEYVPANILTAVGYAPESTRIVDYGSTPDISELLIAVGLGLIALFLLLLARRRVIRNRSLYADRGCPRCNEFELVRIDRKVSDRALSATGIPVYRYACRSCTWRGRRLGLFDNETHFHTARETETAITWSDSRRPAISLPQMAAAAEMEKEPLSSSSISPTNTFVEVGVVTAVTEETEASELNEPVHYSGTAEAKLASETGKVERKKESSPAPISVDANNNLPYPTGPGPMVYPDYPISNGDITLPEPMVVPPELVVESLRDVAKESPIELAPEDFERLVMNSPVPKEDN